MNGFLFDIQRGCLHDGPGIRTVVFFKGCNLRCQWCHNPESFLMRPQLQFDAKRCIKCRRCEAVCDLHRLKDSHSIDFTSCIACGKCVSDCPSHALSIIGREYSLEEIMDEITKDEVYYHISGGGVTFSGGEPTLQPAFLTLLAQSCKQRGYSTALETNGVFDYDSASQFLPYMDLILLDCKLPDLSSYKHFTGRPVALENALSMLQGHHKPVVLRCPVVPGINDHAVFWEYLREVYHCWTCIGHIELMPYHSIGLSKWLKIGVNCETGSIRPPDRETVLAWQNILYENCGPWRDNSVVR